MKHTFRKFIPYVILQALLIQGAAVAAPQESKGQQATQNSDELNRLSEAFGHFIGKNLQSSGIDFNMDMMIKGLRDGMAGKPAPMSEEEYMQLLSKYQEKAQEALAQKNLKEAEEFLSKNARNSTVIELEKGKLQYKVLKPGKGPVVEKDSVPEIQFEGRLLDGTVFGSTQNGQGALKIPLSQTIPGLQKAVTGMREGEKRTIYIHPDLGYGTTGPLPPNALLIFDVDVIKANTQDDASLEGLEEDDNFMDDTDVDTGTGTGSNWP